MVSNAYHADTGVWQSKICRPPPPPVIPPIICPPHLAIYSASVTLYPVLVVKPTLVEDLGTLWRHRPLTDPNLIATHPVPEDAKKLFLAVTFDCPAQSAVLTLGAKYDTYNYRPLNSAPFAIPQNPPPRIITLKDIEWVGVDPYIVCNFLTLSF